MAAVDQDVEVGTIEGAMEVMAPMSANALDRAAIDMQVATAKKYPRSVATAIKEATDLATLDEATAQTMFYVLPARKGQRDDKRIQGPSVKLAEIMLGAWGNARVEGTIVSEDSRFVTAMGTCWDMERNVAFRQTVRRRITGRDGRKYSEDMIAQTSNAATSIAMRNVICRTIPRSFTDKVYQAAQLASVGKGTLAQKRAAALDWFSKKGYDAVRVYRLLEVGGLEDIGIDQIIELRGIVNAVQDGEATLEDIFDPKPESDAARKLDEALAGMPPTPEPKGEPVPAPPPPAQEVSEEEKALISEAYRKASEKASELAKLGKLEMFESEALDEARDKGELGVLIKMDQEFAKRLKVKK